MAILPPSRAYFTTWRAIGGDGVALEILRDLPWRALQTLRRTVARRYLEQNTEMSHGWRNGITLLTKQATRPVTLATPKTDTWHLHSQRSGQVVVRLLGQLDTTRDYFHLSELRGLWARFASLGTRRGGVRVKLLPH